MPKTRPRKMSAVPERQNGGRTRATSDGGGDGTALGRVGGALFGSFGSRASRVSESCGSGTSPGTRGVISATVVRGGVAVQTSFGGDFLRRLRRGSRGA